MRHDPAQTAEGWRPGPREHPADQGRHGLRLPLSERICPRSHPPQKRRGLTRTRQRTATRPPDSATSTVAMVSLGCCSTPSATIKPQTSICAESVTGQTASTPQREKSRLELSRSEPTRYHKVSHNPAAIETLLVDLFLEAHRRTPEQIILDLDATDDPLHGQQEGKFFHGYYDCYCYLPLYIFCGRHLLAAKLRRSNIDGSAGAVEEVARIVAQIRRRWPRIRILLRGDSGFTREALMAWCEANRVDFLFGLARSERVG